jgi:hypothetical protein
MTAAIEVQPEGTSMRHRATATSSSNRPSLPRYLAPLLALLPLAAAAQDPTTDSTLLGVGVRSRPAYDGSDTQRAEAVPVVRDRCSSCVPRATAGGRGTLKSCPANAGLQAACRPPGDESAFSSRKSPIDAGASYGGHLENGKPPSPVNLILRMPRSRGSAPGPAVHRSVPRGIPRESSRGDLGEHEVDSVNVWGVRERH